jgi:predicted metal-dependent hydrolase
VLGQWVIQNRGLDYAGTDPVMLDLSRWHDAEEIEHRSLNGILARQDHFGGDARSDNPR